MHVQTVRTTVAKQWYRIVMVDCVRRASAKYVFARKHTQKKIFVQEKLCTAAKTVIMITVLGASYQTLAVQRKNFARLDLSAAAGLTAMMTTMRVKVMQDGNTFTMQAGATAILTRRFVMVKIFQHAR
mmetsp:Transcript_47505/g.131698  ORF Transcript_47505/g.131698 Transcript_47505/m.131698 type:complete len:128 (-) Transcript_47505:56-439(-)